MHAVLIENTVGDASKLYIGDAPTPIPGVDEVLVKVKAFGLNRLDIWQREGNYPPPTGSSTILGVEFSGIIAAVGADVTQWKIGNEVLGLTGGGAYAEYVLVFGGHLMHKPAHLSWAQAASIPENFLTAFQTLFLCSNLQPGEDVLIHAAASGVGLAAIQLARFHGARTVTGTASSTEKLEMILSMNNGATHAANYRTADFVDTVKQATDGKGVDVIIDLVGQSHWTQNITSLAVDGRMIVVGVVSGTIVPSVDLLPILGKRIHIQGSNLRAQKATYQTDLISRFEKEILSLITSDDGSGPIKTSIHSIYPWTEIQAAHLEMEANKNSGKIIAEIV
ncbi:quinone oxidoreductase [Mycena albidolilacea]|uniref:Quinone oxidoreductase n=1 Tax=Mycena albidolilacea TaxID=1033008 RepID=A0AAD7F4R2_9AGAR|nr:quinone oxidoreductase [Mycena albidolilacea]